MASRDVMINPLEFFIREIIPTREFGPIPEDFPEDFPIIPGPYTNATNGIPTFFDFDMTFANRATGTSASSCYQNKLALKETVAFLWSLAPRSKLHNLTEFKRRDYVLKGMATLGGEYGLKYTEKIYKVIDLDHNYAYLKEVAIYMKGNFAPITENIYVEIENKKHLEGWIKVGDLEEPHRSKLMGFLNIQRSPNQKTAKERIAEELKFYDVMYGLFEDLKNMSGNGFHSSTMEREPLSTRLRREMQIPP